MRIRILTAVWLAFTWACMPAETEPPEVREVQFAPYLAPCPGTAAYPCLMEQRSGETYSTSSIQGLAFEWGVSQRVRLVRHVKENPRVDTTSWAWDVDSVLTRGTESAWSFRTTLDGVDRWRLAGDTLRIEGYDFPISMPIEVDRIRMQMRSGAMIIELEVTPVFGAGGAPGPALQAKLLQVRERPVPG
jgi:hypothetical protein